jgi:hypothetical protein
MTVPMKLDVPKILLIVEDQILLAMGLRDVTGAGQAKGRSKHTQGSPFS